jgi:hypothetical protein
MSKVKLKDVLKMLGECEWRVAEGCNSSYETTKGPYRFIVSSSSGLGPIHPHIELTVTETVTKEEVAEFSGNGFFGPLKDLVTHIEKQVWSRSAKESKRNYDLFAEFVKENTTME